jgi:hypothetical protein
MLPGRCATPGANAAVDEVEKKRLEKQKNNHELLTETEFIKIVLEELRTYENSIHSTLDMTPLQFLDLKVKQGWKPRQIAEQDIDLIVSDRIQRVVKSGRVEIGNQWYWGAEQTNTKGDLDDVGLWNYEGQKVEVRYDRHNPSQAYALVNGSVRKLELVSQNVMLDEDALESTIAMKRRQMKAVREAFSTLIKPIGSVLYRPQREVIKQEEKETAVEVGVDLKQAVAKRLEESTRKEVSIPLLAIYASNYQRYIWCLDMKITEQKLQQKDLDFMVTYKRTQEYQENEIYFRNYLKLGNLEMKDD